MRQTPRIGADLVGVARLITVGRMGGDGDLLVVASTNLTDL